MSRKPASYLISTIAGSLLLLVPALGFADNMPPLTGPETAKKFQQFRKKAGMDFLLPQVFKTHPGVTFYLSHATDLGLSTKQIERLKVIRRKMLDRSLAQMAVIDKLRGEYLKFAAAPNPQVRKLHKMLGQIGWKMAMATTDHLEGHLKAAKVLTKEQWTKVSSLK